MLEQIFNVIGGWIGAVVISLGVLLFGPTSTVPSTSVSQPTVLVSTSTPVAIPAQKVEPIKTIQATSSLPTPQVVVTPSQKRSTPAPTVSPSVPSPLPSDASSTSAKEVAMPPVAPDVPRSDGGALDPADIFILTNEERAKEGLPKLAYSNRLSAIAEVKAMDMIIQQYFEHKSPQGVDVGGLAERYGYAYSHVGENLALGDFASSSHVVNGWMDSPGHRANILNIHYTEIGIAAVIGKWEGRDVWFSVQEFGTPAPDCTKPDPLLGSKIEILEVEIDQTASMLTSLKQEIDSGVGTTEERDQKIDDYNRMVEGYNVTIATERGFVADYNAQVKVYNACMGV